MPIIVFAGLIIVLLWLGVYEPVFQPPYSILVLNTLFLTGSSLVVAWISSRSYLNGAPSNILLLGCAFLINGIAAVVAGWFFSFSANYTVTIYNSCTLLSSILQLANVAFSSQSLDSKSKKTDLKLKLASGYIASVAVVILVSALAYYGFAPKFFINNSGATFVDISVLATTILFFAMSSLLLMRRQLKSKFPALFWYSLGLALFAIGLLGVSFEKSLGDPIGWIGKIAQYVGGLYFLIAVIKARGKAESTDASYSDRWAESFRSDRKQVATLFSNMLDGVVYAKIITDAIGKPVDYVYLDVNDAYERIFSVKKETILGKRVTEVFPDITKDPTKWIDIVGHVAVTGQPTTFENYAQFQNKWIHASLYSPQKGYSVAIFEDITERKKAETEREIMVEFLRIANATNGTRDLVKAATGFFQKQSGCEAVGVRLKEGDDYPYYETRGFPPEHVQLENKLCASDEAGYVIRDSKGEPVLECMCGNVICGRFDPSKKFFTESGSFWTNSTTQLLANTTSADRQGNTRNRCNSEGYESVALIVLRVGDTRLGLLQLNDKRKDMFTLETIQMWERIADRLALALSKTIADEALGDSEVKFRTVADFAYDWEYWIAPDGNMIYVSPSSKRITGYDANEFIKDPKLLTRIVNPEDKSIVGSHFDLISSEELHTVDFRIVTRDGETRWISHSCKAVFDDNGKWIGRRASNRDITERKKMEQ
ncbi:MAG TPA: PAS domain S-box protein, partial [Candidatus Bathyarchaeia archaeon]|nr:PAS domain S-box protein [Candidatus Bathyarchaeia archaeon]